MNDLLKALGDIKSLSYAVIYDSYDKVNGEFKDDMYESFSNINEARDMFLDMAKDVEEYQNPRIVVVIDHIEPPENERWGYSYEGRRDDNGIPIVWENHYVHGRCSTQWSNEWSCQCNDECPSCGAEIEPSASMPINQDQFKPRQGD